MKQIIYVYLHDNDLCYIAVLNPSWKYFMFWLVRPSVGQVIAKLQCRNYIYVLVSDFMTGKFWEYLFISEFLGNYKQQLASLASMCRFVHFMLCYFIFIVGALLVAF